MTIVLRRTGAIARVSFQEFLAKKITWVFLAGGVALVLLGLLLGHLSLDERQRIFTHLGFFATTACGLALALTLAGSSVPQEIERQTSLMALARPISRGQWIFGKWFGMVTLVTIFLVAMSCVHASLLLTLFGSREFVPTRFALAVAATTIEILTVLTFAFALSVRVRPTLAVTGGILLYLAAHWLPDLIFFAEKSQDPFFKVAALVFQWTVPPLYQLNLRSVAFVAGESPVAGSLPLSFAICAGWILVYVQIAARVFRRRDLV